MLDGFDDSRYAWALVGVALALILLLYASGGAAYAFGVVNHNEQVPVVEHYVDGEYLDADWAVSEKTSLESPRFYFTRAMGLLASLLGLQAAYFLVWVLAFFGTIAALFAFARELFDSLPAATVLVGAYLVPGLRSTLFDGGDVPINLDKGDLFANYLIPRTVSEPLVLAGLYLLVTRRYRWGYGVLGVATMLHVVNGLWATVAGTLGVVAMTVLVDADGSLRSPEEWREGFDRLPFDGFAVYGVLGLLGIGPPAVASLLYGRSMEIARTIAWIRHPHHYLPSRWGATTILVTAVLVVGGTALLAWTRETTFRDARAAAFGLAVPVAVAPVLFFGGWVFTEVVTIPVVVKLQPFYAEEVLYVVLLGGLVALPLNYAERLSARSLRTPVLAVVVAALLVATLAAGPTVESVTAVDRPGYVENPDGSRADAYRWIRGNTPEDAVFVIPPSLSSFRLGADRAIVVDFKTFVFTPDGTVEWKERMSAVCNRDVAAVEGGGFGVLGECDDGYASLGPGDIQEIAREYDACWMLMGDAELFMGGLEREYSNAGYSVYRITMGPCPESPEQ